MSVTLLPEHEQMLTASGIAPEVATARGYKSITTLADLGRLGFGDQQRLVPTLLIPVWNINGDIALWHHRPNTPRMKDSKIVKYEFPTGSRMAVDVHPHIRDKVRDPNIPLLITEGVKKADAAISHGLCCVGVIGTWNWRGTNEYGGKTALPDWDGIALKDRANQGRQVYICYDSDAMLKPQVHQALERLSGFLKQRGATVAYIYLPHGEYGAKTGLDDYLAAGHTTEELFSLASPELQLMATDGGPTGITGSSAQKSQASLMIDLATSEDGCELFHTPEGDTYVSFKVRDHIETWSLKSQTVRHWLERFYYITTGGAPGSQSVQDALSVLKARARFDGEAHPVHVRLARHKENIYLDLCDDRWNVVEVTPNGWQVTNKTPVRFRRSKGMIALPTPVRGGRIDELRPFVNVASEDDWALLVAFIAAALRPEGPYPTLAIAGEQGSCKSTLARLVRRIVDPSSTPLRSEPRNTQDLMIAATNSWVPTFDNLSHISAWLSDALCRLSTGGGFAARELYADAEESIFDATRPVILTSIEDIATRGDLLDRALILTLQPMPESSREDEAAFWHAFEAVRPRILGAFLDAVVSALHNLPSVKLTNLPRMADFAKWAVAAETGLGLQPGVFMRAYRGNRADARELALDAIPVIAHLREVIDKRSEGVWQGSAEELLKELNIQAGHDDRKRPPEGWPKRANNLSGQLKRAAPNLRQCGIDVQFPTRTGKRRSILIRKVGEDSVTIVTSVIPTPEGGLNDDAPLEKSAAGDAAALLGDVGDAKLQDYSKHLFPLTSPSSSEERVAENMRMGLEEVTTWSF
jgi:hypothetical protein